MPRNGSPPTPIAEHPPGRTRSGRRRASWHGDGDGTRMLAPALLGMLAALLALVPLAGWGTGWAALAAFAAGWPVISPLSAAAVLVAGLAVTAQGQGGRHRVRRGLAAAGGAFLLLVVAWGLLARPADGAASDAATLVERWPAQPALLLHHAPSLFTLGALAFLGVALLLLAARSATAVRGAWIMAAAAALVALLTGGSPVDPDARAQPAAAEAVAAIPPPLAFMLLLLASALLLLRTPEGGWWVPGGRVREAVVRLLLPGTLLLLPGLVWLEELMERRQLLTADTGRSMLAAGLVIGVALLVANAVWRLGYAQSSELEREQRRLQRQLEVESQHVARRADQTLRVATDRYRAHLRGILDVAPAAFVAVDRDGHVAYLNDAAAELFHCPPSMAAGRPLWEVWPELGPELRGALGAAKPGATLHQTLVSGRTGRAVELRGYPDEAGAALFLHAPTAHNGGR